MGSSVMQVSIQMFLFLALTSSEVAASSHITDDNFFDLTPDYKPGPDDVMCNEHFRYIAAEDACTALNGKHGSFDDQRRWCEQIESKSNMNRPAYASRIKSFNEKFKEVFSSLVKSGFEHLMMDLEYRGPTKDDFFWGCGERMSYSNWADGYPNDNITNNRCTVATITTKGISKWINVPCDRSNDDKFITACEARGMKKMCQGSNNPCPATMTCEVRKATAHCIAGTSPAKAGNISDSSKTDAAHTKDDQEYGITRGFWIGVLAGIFGIGVLSVFVVTRVKSSDPSKCKKSSHCSKGSTDRHVASNKTEKVTLVAVNNLENQESTF